ncbi:MAG: ankyrin repeat protein [Arenicella sp.]
MLLAIGIGIYGGVSDSYGPNGIVQHINDGELEVDDVAKFIDRGADINIRDQHGETALYTAMYSDQESLILKLIEQGADVNQRTGVDGSSPFKYALQDSESLTVIRALLAKGASVDFSIDDMTLLAWVRESENEELATLLLEFVAK